MSNQEQKKAEETARMAGYMRRSRFALFWYGTMRGLMIIEGILWTAMDFFRSLRMKAAARINRNYEQFLREK